MNEPTGSRRDAASTIFNLPDYRVIDAIDLPGGGRRITIESTYPPGCPACGVVAGATTARVEAANTGIKNIKRTGRGFKNSANYKTRILLTSAARAVA